MEFAAGAYLSEAPSPPMTPYSPSYTLYTCTYCILIQTGKGDVELTGEKVRGATVHKTGSTIPT